jgi:hypothetical protein
MVHDGEVVHVRAEHANASLEHQLLGFVVRRQSRWQIGISLCSADFLLLEATSNFGAKRTSTTPQRQVSF